MSLDRERTGRSPESATNFIKAPANEIATIKRHATTYIAPKLAAFQAKPDIHRGMTAFSDAIVNNATVGARGGCMMAATAVGQSERIKEIRSYVAKGLTVTADIFAKRFEQEMKAGYVPLLLGK